MPEAPWNGGIRRGSNVWAGGEDTGGVREGCRHCSSPIPCLPAGLAELRLMLAWARPRYLRSQLMATWLMTLKVCVMGLPPHPRSWCWPVPTVGIARKPVFPPLALLPPVAHGKVAGPRAGAWREVAREGPLLPRASADALLPAPPRIPRCWPRANSCAKPTPCLFSPPPKWSPCLVNFYLVAYLEAVETDRRGPSAAMVPYLIIFPKPDY